MKLGGIGRLGRCRLGAVGPHRFSVAHPDDVSRQPDGGVVLTDTDGIRHRIPPAAALDPRSQRLLERAL